MWSEGDASATSRQGKIAYSFHPFSYTYFSPSLLPLSLCFTLSLSICLSLALFHSLFPHSRSPAVLKHLCECDRRSSFGQAYYLPLSKMLQTLIQRHAHTLTHTNPHIHLIKHTQIWGCGAKNIKHALIPQQLCHISLYSTPASIPVSAHKHIKAPRTLNLKVWIKIKRKMCKKWQHVEIQENTSALSCYVFT